MEHFFSPNSGEDQKKGLHQKWNTYFPRIQVQTCAQMHTRVKLLEGMQMKTILKLMGGLQSNYTPRVSAPLLGKTLDAYFPLGPSSLPAMEAQPEERLANRTQKMLGVIGVAKIFD